MTVRLEITVPDIVEDSTPQLGGDLDINGFSIVSVSAGNINITPDTTGSIVLDGLSWPQADGSGGQVLRTDGAGQLSFISLSGSQNLFETIAVATQSNVVADTTTDTLTFVAGTNMTITTNASTDTITFDATGGGGDRKLEAVRTSDVTLGVADTTMLSWAMPAGQLATDGDTVDLEIGIVDIVENMEVKLKLGSTTVVSVLTGGLSGNMIIKARLMRTGAATQRGSIESPQGYIFGTGAETLSGALTVSLTSTGPTGSPDAKFGYIKYSSAA
ncbi:hypothetical protein LCGC14_1213680 [marine sediment metagenome]|uniref:Uncharacterized protein n=1 Tax=marine sediment metagenome TaxID=412755 RepID=A0A0F9LHG9_9ZZZZ